MNSLSPMLQQNLLTRPNVEMILNMSDYEILAESEKQGIGLSTSANFTIVLQIL